ncbi:MAG: phage replisome organizer N-terminal domain-containing protein, partial [Patescibacteria group bacterium]
MKGNEMANNGKTNWHYEHRPMNWLKIWTAESYKGSLFNKLTLEEVGLFLKYLILAAMSHRKGVICFDGGVADIPYTFDQLSAMTKVSIADIERISKGLLKAKMISIKDGLIYVSNWQFYQNDFQRDKGYSAQKDVPETMKQEDTGLEDRIIDKDNAYHVLRKYIEIKKLAKEHLTAPFYAR